MKFLYDFLPIAIFFIIYKFFGIYPATGAAILISIAQVIFQKIRKQPIDKIQWITLIIIVLLGGATLFFHNDMFIKWKPSVINWAFAIAFASAKFFTQKPLIQSMLEKEIKLPTEVWSRLNLMWIVFFFAVGVANVVVIYTCDTDTWVNFKLFGMLGLTVLFVIFQSLYLARHIKNQK